MVLPSDTPFRYEEPISPDELVNRDQEIETLLERALAGRNTRLVAPRRYGKTSLLRRVLRDGRRRKLVGVYVDFYGVLSPADVATRIDLAYGESLDGRLRSWFAGVRQTLHPVGRVSAGPASVEVGADPAGPVDNGRALLERLRTPHRLAQKHGRQVLVVFDEFQAVLAADAQIDAVFRSEIQHHGDLVAYIFAGSQPGMMRELFGDRRRPFFDQAAPLALKPLPADALADEIARRFERSSRDCSAVLEQLLKLAAGHPQRAMQLAAHLWAHTPEHETADSDTWRAALATVGQEVGEGFRARWDHMPSTQRRALSALAAGDPPFGSVARERHGTSKGATSSALRRLADDGEAAEDQHGAWRLIDPLFTRWVRSGRRWPE